MASEADISYLCDFLGNLNHCISVNAIHMWNRMETGNCITELYYFDVADLDKLVFKNPGDAIYYFCFNRMPVSQGEIFFRDYNGIIIVLYCMRSTYGIHEFLVEYRFVLSIRYFYSRDKR